MRAVLEHMRDNRPSFLGKRLALAKTLTSRNNLLLRKSFKNNLAKQLPRIFFFARKKNRSSLHFHTSLFATCHVYDQVIGVFYKHRSLCDYTSDAGNGTLAQLSCPCVIYLILRFNFTVQI